MHAGSVITSDAAEVVARLDALAACTDSLDGITRLFLSPAHRRAVELVLGWMEQAGLRTSLDASGTVIGRSEHASDAAPVLILGSHIDTVRHAGRYDGCLGVVAAIAVAARLRGTRLPYAIEIRAFGDEEGVRFPVTLTGARATAGRFDPAWLKVKDSDGTALGEALHAWGLGGATLSENGLKAAHAFAYLELHIEQGPVLDMAGIPLGVVTAINGAARFTVTVEGRAGHAGTVPMAARQDALVAAAAMILAIRQVACAASDVVATIGQLAVSPGAVNVIPGTCVFSIDLRAPTDEQLRTADAAIRQALMTAAEIHGTRVAIARMHEAGAVACDSRLQDALSQAVSARGMEIRRLPSGAGHDAMAIADLCPIGMLFVRSAGGISHDPAEFSAEPDIAAALDVLEDVLRQLEPGTFLAAPG